MSDILRVTTFLGKSFYKKALLAVGDYRKRIDPDLKTYLKSGIDNPFSIISKPKKVSEEDWKVGLLRDINQIARNGMKERQSHYKIKEAQSIDCLLYAKKDQYKNK